MTRKLDVGLDSVHSEGSSGLARAFGGGKTNGANRKIRRKARRRLSREYRERRLEAVRCDPLADCRDGL